MWQLSILPFVLVTLISVPAKSAECMKTFDSKKTSALEGEVCKSQALNDADDDLNSAYTRMIGRGNGGIFLWAAQKHWVDARNSCVASGKEDCVAMTKARTTFFDLLAGAASGEHRFGWIGASSGSVGQGGYEATRAFYLFAKPASAGEELFNKVIMQELMKSRDTVGSANKVREDPGKWIDRRCLNWVISGTATLSAGVIRVPIHTFLGCNDPPAAETTSFLAVDLDRALVVQ
jgi:uncharacterized protein YecT (DUF1311 family)